jgi:hypothetical protein
MAINQTLLPLIDISLAGIMHLVWQRFLTNAKKEGYKLSEEELEAVSGGVGVVVLRSRSSGHKSRINRGS